MLVYIHPQFIPKSGLNNNIQGLKLHLDTATILPTNTVVMGAGQHVRKAKSIIQDDLMHFKLLEAMLEPQVSLPTHTRN